MGTERGTAEDESGRNVYINIDAKLEKNLKNRSRIAKMREFIVPLNGRRPVVVADTISVSGEESMDQAPIYDLGGRRLAAPRKGINIVGGKKVLMR